MSVQQQQRDTARTPARQAPLQDLDRMRRMLEETFGDWSSLLQQAGVWVPRVDIEETDDAYVVQAEVPGVKSDDVDIELNGSELFVTGEVKEVERKGILRKQERRVGRFEYRVRLPDEIDGDNVEANLEDGILSIRVPKSQKSSHRKIQIKK